MAISTRELFSAARQALARSLDAQGEFEVVLTGTPTDLRRLCLAIRDRDFDFAAEFRQRYQALDAAQSKAAFALRQIRAYPGGPTDNLFSDEEDGKLFDYAGIEAKNCPQWVIRRGDLLRESYLIWELENEEASKVQTKDRKNRCVFPPRRSPSEMVLHHCELPVEYDRRHVDERLDEVFRRVQKKAEEAEGTVTTPVASKHSEAHSLLRFQNGSMSLIEEDGDAITKRRQPQGGKAQSEKGKAAREYLASVPHIIQMLKQHHLDENGYVGNPEAMGFNKIVERLELNYSKGKKNHVTKFFEKEFTKRGSLKGWQLYANAFAGSGNESTLLKWLKHVDKSAADAIIESADETVAEAADEPPEGDTSKCECGQPLLPGDKLWGECAACRQPEYK